MDSPKGVTLDDIECIAKASISHDNTKDDPITEKERCGSHMSIGAESEGGTNCGNKRRSTADSQSQPKRVTRNHSKPTQAKEVLRLLTDQQSQPESPAVVRV